MYYITGGEGQKRKDRKIRKSRGEEKVMNFRSASLLPTRKQEPVTQGGTRGPEHLTRRTLGTGVVKGWKEKQDRGHIPETRITRTQPP